MCVSFDPPGRKVKKRLFKYYPLKEHNISAFLNGELFFARPHMLNDSFDTSAKLIDPFSIFTKFVHWDERKAMLMDRHGICSFIEAKDVKNSRMWSFYADNYNGFALEFVPEELSGVKYGNIHLMPVTYLNAPLDLNDLKLVIKKKNETFRIGDITKDFDKNLDRIFECLHLVKEKKVWADENEWRMIIGDIAVDNQLYGIRAHKDGYLLPLKENPYKGLYIGYKVSYSDRCTLFTIAMKKGIPVYSVMPKIINNQWDMEIQPLEK